MKIITYLPSLMVPFLIASSTVKIKASQYGGYLIFTVLLGHMTDGPKLLQIFLSSKSGIDRHDQNLIHIL